MHTSFDKATWEAFKANNRPGPIHMLNLIRLKDAADYPDGRTASGRDAYSQYSTISAPVFRQHGGKIVWRGNPELLMIGAPEEIWDICFIAEYPGVGAFLEMMKSPVYRDAMRHRQAGVLDCRLIRLQPVTAGESFSV
jgi:uncharacterized protein (DUF1330 family)